jgi:hypothetical protein
MRNRTRLILLTAVAVVCVGAAVAYVGISLGSEPSDEASGTRVVGPATLGLGATPIRTTDASSIDSGDLLFVSMIPDRSASSLAVVSLSDLAGTRAIAGLRCERASYAGGRGICLSRHGGEEAESEVEIFDSKFHVGRRFEVEGAPSRAGVSPDGRYAAVTTFEASEEEEGSSEGPYTETRIFDLETGKEVADLEDLQLTKDGKPFARDDLHISAVTFAHDDDHFFASLGSAEANSYLLEGSLRDRKLKVIAEGVDSPSLSPDGTHIAFRRLVGGDGNWRLFVIDLRTRKATRLAGNDPIDDQAEWLDDRRVVYVNDNKLWVVAADGSGQPRQILSYAYSPTVIPAS